MFQSMLVTSLTPLQAKNEMTSWENRPFTATWPEVRENNTTKEIITRTIKKKSKRIRTAFTTEQLNQLEETFHLQPYIDAKKRAELAKRTRVGERQIKIWFQNRRMKKKRESSESISDYDSTLTTSPPQVTSSTVEPSLLQQFIQGTNNSLEDQYQPTETQDQAPDIKTEVPYQLPSYAAPNIFGYDYNLYQTENYTHSAENDPNYYYSEADASQFQYNNNHVANWYGYDGNNYQNDRFYWQ